MSAASEAARLLMLGGQDVDLEAMRSGSSVFEEEPVPLDVFITDRAYLGNPRLSPVQYDAVRHAERVYYPETYELLATSSDKVTRDYWSEPVRMVNFLELEWGKGAGKDHTCRITAMRVCYLLLCLNSPQDYYEMPMQDSIHVLNVASSSKQAQRAFFAPMRRAVTRPGCWFQRRIGIDILDAAERRSGRSPERTTALLDTIRFEKNIEAVSGHSDADSQEGLNLILGIADEIDAFRSAAELAKSGGVKQRDSSSSAESILNMLRTSASTRFPSTYKNMHISYPRYLGSTIQQLVARGRSDIAAKGEAGSRYYVSGPLATWDVNPRVPGREAFTEDYEKDPALAEAKYECRPRRAVNPYFSNETMLRESTFEVAQYPVTVDYVREAATWKPVYDFSPDFFPVKGALYAMHADLAVTGDRAGVSLAHVKRWQDHAVIGTQEDGIEIQVKERRPVVKVDFTISYESSVGAVPPREIQIRWARMLCLELRRLGFPIVRFTFDQYQCYTFDVQILQLNGTSVPIGEMVQRHTQGEEQWVYSCTEDGQVRPGKVVSAWKTSDSAPLVEVELDNGEKVKCTPEHLWMLRDGTYRQAGQLLPGDSLMPLYRQARQVSLDSQVYEQVWHPGKERWEFTHRMVSRGLGFGAGRGQVIHHGFDGLRQLNNDPRNLTRMTKEAHAQLHKGTPEWRREQSARSTDLQLGKTGREARRYRHDVTFEQVQSVAEQLAALGGPWTWRSVAQVLGCGQWPIYDRVREAGFASWKEFKWSVQPRKYGALAQAQHRERKKAGTARTYQQRAPDNHKVVAVRPVPSEPVYDIEVEGYHNFALAAGVFVHNSKDSMQILEQHGIETDRFSTDVSEEGWRTLRDVMYDGRLEMPARELVIIELLGLSRLPNGKIDHLGDSSKDEADSLAGAVAGALELGGQEDPSGKRAYVGTFDFYQGDGMGTSQLVPLGMPAGGQMGPGEFLPESRPGMEFGGDIFDWGPTYEGGPL